MTIEKALREALAAHDAAIVLDPAKGYHFGGAPSIEEIAKSIAARLPAASARAGGAQYREAVEALRDEFYRTLPPAGHPIVRGFAQRVLALLADAAPVSEAAELRWLDYAETWQAWEAYNRAATKVGSGFTDEQMTGASALLGWLTVAWLGRHAAAPVSEAGREREAVSEIRAALLEWLALDPQKWVTADGLRVMVPRAQIEALLAAPRDAGE